jgi:hypothetical protein
VSHDHPMDRRPVRRFRPDPSAPRPPEGVWPVAVPAVDQLLREGLDLAPGATVLVGENGSGKSTVLEVLAGALGLNAEGGSRHTRHSTRRSEPGSLGLIVERSPGADRWAYFLRDETLHGLYSYLEAHPPPGARSRCSTSCPTARPSSPCSAGARPPAASTCSTSPTLPCRSPGPCRSSSSCPAWSPVGRRSSSPRTPLCWPPCPAHVCWRSATGACGRPRGTTSS